jgi:hypothetical protein
LKKKTNFESIEKTTLRNSFENKKRWALVWIETSENLGIIFTINGFIADTRVDEIFELIRSREQFSKF